MIMRQNMKLLNVAPFAGAWIEIYLASVNSEDISVAPFAGAWIEINIIKNFPDDVDVAPFAGAWIEIIVVDVLYYILVESLPSRERGLKLARKLRRRLWN